MSADPPPGFTRLGLSCDAARTGFVNVIGLVTDFLEPTQSRGTDYVFTFSLDDGSTGGQYGQKVKFFRPNPELMPPIQSQGDVVLLRNVKTIGNHGDVLVSNRTTSWAVFPSDSIPRTASPSNAALVRQSVHQSSLGSTAPTPAEMRWVISVKNRQDESNFTAPPSQEALQKMRDPGKKHSVLKKLAVDGFFDLTGQVIKIFPIGDRLELYLSDYTSNPFLFDYKYQDIDPLMSDLTRKWPGPFGQRTIQVTLWRPHAGWTCANVTEHDFVMLRNVRTKYNENGTKRLEGILHTDRYNMDRVNVTKLPRDDDFVKDVLRNKRTYEEHFARQHGSKKRSSDATGDIDSAEGEIKEPSKSARRKKRKKEKERQQREANANGTVESNGNMNGTAESNGNADRPVEPSSSATAPQALPEAKLDALNPEIRCAEPDHPARTVFEILQKTYTHWRTQTPGVALQLPVSDIRSRTVVRVVDFQPHDLRDFTTRRRVRADDGGDDDERSDGGYTSSSSEGSGSESDDSDKERGGVTYKWVWSFALLLEDANAPTPASQKPQRIMARVCGRDAEYLLKLDATDLRRDARTRAQLREKLFLLWGDLEERKRKAIDEEKLKEADMQGQPVATKRFATWLKEYGVRREGSFAEYVRNVRLERTTIR